MGVDANTMANALTRARALMTPEAQNKIQSHHGKVVAESYNYGDYNMDMLPQQTAYIPETTNTNGSIQSKLPKAIMESMMTTQIDTSCLAPSDDLDNLMKKVQQNTPQQTQHTQIINEERIMPLNTSGIDYNYIRTIIEECIDKKFRELNENTLKGIKLKEGKIALVDNGGNVFHAELEYKGKQKK